LSKPTLPLTSYTRYEGLVILLSLIKKCAKEFPTSPTQINSSRLRVTQLITSRVESIAAWSQLIKSWLDFSSHGNTRLGAPQEAMGGEVGTFGRVLKDVSRIETEKVNHTLATRCCLRDLGRWLA
jgi:hypothetical protein